MDKVYQVQGMFLVDNWNVEFDYPLDKLVFPTLEMAITALDQFRGLNPDFEGLLSVETLEVSKSVEEHLKRKVKMVVL